jgi:hypothetical protein
MRQLTRESALHTASARLAVTRSLAQQQLAEPERQALLADSAGALQQDARGDASRRDAGRESLTKRGMAVKRDDGHTEICSARFARRREAATMTELSQDSRLIGLRGRTCHERCEGGQLRHAR